MIVARPMIRLFTCLAVVLLAFPGLAATKALVSKPAPAKPAPKPAVVAPPASASTGSMEKVGKAGEGRWVTPTNQVITPAGRSVDLYGLRPQALALSPDGKLLATAGRTSELILIDPVSGKVLQKVPLPPEKPADLKGAGAPTG